MDAFDADVLIYAAVPGHPLGRRVAALIGTSPVPAPVGVGSVLLLPEVLGQPLRDGAAGEIRILAGLLARLDLRPVDLATAELATSLSARHKLKAVDATHLAIRAERRDSLGQGIPVAYVADDRLSASLEGDRTTARAARRAR